MCAVMIVILKLSAALMVAIAIQLPRITESVSHLNPKCRVKCGHVEIPFPFGITPDCYLNDFFSVSCNETYNPPKPFLNQSNYNNSVELLEISLHRHILRVADPVARDCYDSNGNLTTSTLNNPNISHNFPISVKDNMFIAVGCNALAFIVNSDGNDTSGYISGCVSTCESFRSVTDGTCSGIGCCQMSINPVINRGSQVVSVHRWEESRRVLDFSPCSFAFVVEANNYTFLASHLKELQEKETVPVVLDWAVGIPENVSCKSAEKDASTYACKDDFSECRDANNGEMGYQCHCQKGYKGNPYLVGGCKDIDECKDSNPCIEKCTNLPGDFKCSCPAGHQGDGNRNGTGCYPKDFTRLYIFIVNISILVIFATSSWVIWIFRKRKFMKRRERFFEQNGGLLLQQKLSGHNGSIETTIIFEEEELKKATNSYGESQVVGQGGFGTVYKGILTDSRVVAIKKSIKSNQRQIEQFINEVMILLQINHRNVVKLLGCCLETEVPLLVYEFIPNGTLFMHIHNPRYAHYFSWEIRLKIAAETAGALAYLHSATTTPIIHRDIKSSNILLDQNYTAKVSDFGASRLIPLDYSELTTVVQGTFGYLDPEYVCSGQLTEKSDVYSFGVVLAELLTSLEAIYPRWETNLAMYFVNAMKENQLLQILDNRLVKEDNIEQMKQVAMVADWCLRVKSEERPSMKEVAMALEAVRTMENQPWENVDLVEEQQMEPRFNPKISLDLDAAANIISPCDITSAGYEYSIIDQESLVSLSYGR